MDNYEVCCNCGYSFTFERDALPGAVVWLQCEKCSGIFQAGLPGCDTTRKTREKTQAVQSAVFDIFAEMTPRLTVRQVFYALSVRGVVPKTEAGYRQAQYQLAILRRAGVLPYGWLADSTRWQIKPTSYTGLDAAMSRWHETYRRDLWAAQTAHVEIWIEKDALAGVVAPVTQLYDVPLCVARGYSSMTFGFDMAQEIKAIGKPAYIYHFGDFDPSGVDAAYKIRDTLQGHGANIHFERVAITEQQIQKYNLPTRPTKRKDPRAKAWGDKASVELDALPANVLRDLVKDCVERHIDKRQLNVTQQAERLERATLAQVMKNFVPVPN